MEEVKIKIAELKDRLSELAVRVNLEDKRKELTELEAKALKDDFWQDRKLATSAMEKISNTKNTFENFENLEKRIQSGIEFLQTTKVMSDSEKAVAIGELKAELERIEKELLKLEQETYLSRPYDKLGAIISIHAGQGGVEACDWVAMLQRMYLKYFASKNWKFRILDELPAEEAGIKSTTIEVEKPFAFGFLKGEAGVHRLVRLSPFNAANLRQTSFALVEVIPAIEDEVEIEIRPEDIEFEAFRSSGHGGQNVNKVSTAVRVKHLPTGITVTCQAERYQARNREIALKILKSRILQLELEKRRAEKEKLKGVAVIPGWGNQIRSYVLHPYKMVKDLRTGWQTNQAEEVLNGNLEPFLKAELKTGVSLV